MKKFVTLIIAAILLIPNYSCDKGSKGGKTLLPNITGAAGEVVVVLNSAAHNEPLGLAFRSILGDEYPMIPQSEPLFDLVMIPPSGFTNIFKSHRNIIITKVGNEFEKAQIVPQRDVWAAPQTVLNIVGPTFPAIAKMLENEKDRLVQLLEQAERDRMERNATKFEAKGIKQLLEDKFGVSLIFPKGYTLKLDTTDFVWLTYESPSTSQGILIYEYPYTDTNTFTMEYLVEKRNSFVHKFVPGPTSGSYMTTEKIIPPTFNQLMFKGRYFGQLRGLWDVYSHPMGGPFVSLTTVDEERGRVITVEGFVYAPRFKKRNYVRQVEAILLTFALQ